MKRKMHRKRYYHRKNNMRIKTITVVLSIFFSVGAGYVTATYLIGPALGLEAQPIFSDFIKEDNTEEKKQEEKTNVKVVQDELDVSLESGYALQYGSFSSKDGAETFAAELSAMDLTVNIIEKDGTYKVIGEVYDTKSEAEVSKEQSPLTEDVFITEIP